MRSSFCRKYTPSTRDTYPFLNPYPHVNTVKMSELIITSSAYIIPGDSPMTSVANTVAMTSFAVHTLQPHIFYRLWAHSPTARHLQSATCQGCIFACAQPRPLTLSRRLAYFAYAPRAAGGLVRLRVSIQPPARGAPPVAGIGRKVPIHFLSQPPDLVPSL